MVNSVGLTGGVRKDGRVRPRVVYGGDQDEELSELHRRFAALEEEARASHEIATSKVGNASILAASAAGNGAGTRSARACGNSANSAASSGAGNKLAQTERAKPGRKEVAGELKRLDEQITALRRKHDDLAHANMLKRRELDKLSDKLRELARESKRPTSDNPLVKEIKALEKRLERAVQRYDDAQEVRKTYEQIVSRLKGERLTFANQLAASEATLKAKELDYEELLLMSHDANHAKEMAKQELARFEAIVGEERKAREKELHERRALVSQKQDLNAELERREKARKEAARDAEHAEELRRAQAGEKLSEAQLEEEAAKIAACAHPRPAPPCRGRVAKPARGAGAAPGRTAPCTRCAALALPRPTAALLPGRVLPAARRALCLLAGMRRPSARSKKPPESRT